MDIVYNGESLLSGIGPVGSGSSIPTGFIGAWWGTLDTIPEGWALCDGTNGTPDLRDRFILGAGGKYTVDDIGGEEEHTLTTAEIPIHYHSINVRSNIGALTQTTARVMFNLTSGSKSYNSQYIYGDTSDQIAGSIKVGSVADTNGRAYNAENIGQSHNNMPPYYALYYIIKI